MLEVKNLTKSFNSLIAVNNVSFSIDKGEIFGLLGPNGAGKTTIIRCILDILKPDSGIISYNGQNYDLKKVTGYLPEERGLYMKSRVFDLLIYYGKLKARSTSFLVNRLEYLLEKLELKDIEQKRVYQLSKGNQQKVQLIATLISDPEIVILDEPFSGLDPINQQLVKDLIQEISREDKITILSSHQMEIAEKLCHKILLINKGRTIHYGLLSEIKKIYGHTSLHVRASNIQNDLGNFDEIESADIYENYAELQLKNNIDVSAFIKKLVGKYHVSYLELKEPSLHRIFIESVKKSNQQ